MADNSLSDILEKPAELMPMRWRALLFDKSGKSYRGKTEFDTKEGADKRIYEFEIWLRNSENGALATLDGDIAKEDYRYSIPMPELL